MKKNQNRDGVRGLKKKNNKIKKEGREEKKV
jgi:hypothetical protein